MKVVKLYFPGGALLMPARTPYERELLFENVAFYASRDGGAELELRTSPQRVKVVRATDSDRCASCGQTILQIVFIAAGVRRCRRCFETFRPPSRARVRPERLF